MNTNDESHSQDPVVLHHGGLERGSLTIYKDMLMIGHMDRNGYLYKLRIMKTLKRRGPLSMVTGTEPLQPPSELVKLVLLSGTFI